MMDDAKPQDPHSDDPSVPEEDENFRALQQKAAAATLMAGMVHDTRNIMTGLLSFAQVGKRRAAQPDSQIDAVELFEDIEEDTLRCIEIFDHLLSVVRGEDNGGAGTPRCVDLEPLTRSAAALVHGKAQLARVAVVLDVPPMSVRGTPTGLLQIILNLAINAVEATPPGGRVSITGSVEGGEARLCVHDTGPGVEASNLDKVFEPYFTTKAAAGTGLGLSTSRALARRFGGDLTLDPPAEDQGATFCLRLREWGES